MHNKPASSRVQRAHPAPHYTVVLELSVRKLEWNAVEQDCNMIALYTRRHTHKATAQRKKNHKHKKHS